MSINRYAKKKDAGQAQVVDALRRVGCLVMVLDDFDLLVMRAERLFMLEVKDGSKKPSARELTPKQRSLIQQGWPLTVVLSPIDALRAVGFRDVQQRVEDNADAVRRQAAAVMASHADGLQTHDVALGCVESERQSNDGGVSESARMVPNAAIADKRQRGGK